MWWLLEGFTQLNVRDSNQESLNSGERTLAVVESYLERTRDFLEWFTHDGALKFVMSLQEVCSDLELMREHTLAIQEALKRESTLSVAGLRDTQSPWYERPELREHLKAMASLIENFNDRERRRTLYDGRECPPLFRSAQLPSQVGWYSVVP